MIIRICDAREKVGFYNYPNGVGKKVALAKASFIFSFYNISETQKLYLFNKDSVPIETDRDISEVISEKAKMLAKLKTMYDKVDDEKSKYMRIIRAGGGENLGKFGKVLNEFIVEMNKYANLIEYGSTLELNKNLLVFYARDDEGNPIDNPLVHKYQGFWAKLQGFKDTFSQKGAIRIKDAPKIMTITPGFYSFVELRKVLSGYFTIDPKTAEVTIGSKDLTKLLMRPGTSKSETSHGELFDMLKKNRYPDLLIDYKKINIHLKQFKYGSSISADGNKTIKDDILYSVDVLSEGKYPTFFGEHTVVKPTRLDFFELSDGIHQELEFYFSSACGKRIEFDNQIAIDLMDE